MENDEQHRYNRNNLPKKEDEVLVESDSFLAQKKTATTVKMKILKWRGVANWRWDVDDSDCCPICRKDFDACCPDCKIPGDSCPPVIGNVCKHTFHLHCIYKWVSQQGAGKQQCPMCRAEWKWDD